MADPTLQQPDAPQPITVGSKSGTVVYIDGRFQPVDVEHATYARVLFDDGSSAFYRVDPPESEPEGL